MNPSLRKVGSKIARAREHLDAIDDETVRFARSDPYRVVADFDEKNLAYFDKPTPGYVAVLRQVVRLDTERLSLLAGDCVHNLRSALDHLAWRLVLSNGSTPDEKTYFPVLADRLTDGGKVRKIKVVGGVDPAALAIIESLQPYHAAEDPTLHPLQVLSDLDNIDKHRTLHAVAVSAVSLSVVLADPDGRTLISRWAMGTFEDGAPMTFFSFATDQGPVDMGGDLTARVTLADFAAVAQEPISDLLDRLIRFVETDVVRPLAPFIR